MRPLPVASARPLPASGAVFVDAARGDDANDGSLAKPWKTLGHAVGRLQPGATLVLRGGVYHEQVTLTRSGTAAQPLTLRSYPNELAIVDGGLPEFLVSPATAWEPCPDGAPGEFRSVKTYPDLGGTVGGVNVLGRFGDSLNPLHGYRFLSDLRSANAYWNIANKVGEDEKGIYCGPGLFYDLKTGRIHVRLAHTSLQALGEANYRGETDPRKLALVVAGQQGGPPLTLRGARYIVLQDLVLRGARDAALAIADGRHIVCDGLTAYGGSTGFRVRDTFGLKVVHTACRGIAGPWTFRGHLKYRSTEARLFSASGWDPTGQDNRDFELAYSEFTDSVDGVFLGNVQGVRFHHNLLDNVSDDGIFLTATTAPDGVTHGGDVHIYQNLLARCLTTFAFGVGHGRQKATATGKQTGSGVQVYRNVFDFRRPVHYGIPANADHVELTDYGRVAGDHGGPAWEPMDFYHNTVVSRDAPFRGYYGAGLGGHLGGGTRRRVFNSIFLQVDGLPGNVFSPPDVRFQADGNLHWGVAAGPGFTGDFFGKFRQSPAFAQSKTQYPPGWAASDRFADPQVVRFNADWRQPLDLRLLDGSPAAEAGVTVPPEWADPVRSADKGKPDCGALPLGAEPAQVGVRGRLSMFGTPVTAAVPVVELAPFQPLEADIVRSIRKTAALVEGYPARDADFVKYLCRQQEIPLEVFDNKRGWLDTREYTKYDTVIVVGSLVRAKMEPNKYTKEDLGRVKAFLEQGGALLLLRGGLEPFATPDGRDFLIDVTGAESITDKSPLQLKLPEHPWVKHLDPKGERPWLAAPQAEPLRVRQGQIIIGSEKGRLATLYQQRVGKGQLIYLGWEIAASLPGGRLPSTPEKERVFEDQVRILKDIFMTLYVPF